MITEKKLQDIICALDVLEKEEIITIIGGGREFTRLLWKLHEAKEMIGREKMEEWQKAITKTCDILHYLKEKEND